MKAKPLPQDIAELTSLRFFASLYVILFHTFDNLIYTKDLGTGFFKKGSLGVDLFFILSEFILMHVYYEKYRKNRFFYLNFMINRFARVYPLHLFMIGCFLVLYAIAIQFNVIKNPEGMNWSHLPFHLLALHAWGFTDWHSWNFPSWSISAEFFAYLAFPLFLMIARVPAFIGLALTYIVFAAISFVLCGYGVRFTSLMYNFGILRIAVEFAFGVFLYRISNDYTLGKTATVSALGACLAALLVCLHYYVSDLLIIPLICGIVFLVSQLSKLAGGNMLRSKALIYLGQISYSTYMVHYFVQLVFISLATRLLKIHEVMGVIPWIAMITAIYTSSALTHRFIELPARRLIKSYSEGKLAVTSG